MVAQESQLVGCMSTQIRFLNLGTIEIPGWIILCCRAAVLCVVGCLAASLVSTHCTLVAPLSCDNQKYLQTLLNVP